MLAPAAGDAWWRFDGRVPSTWSWQPFTTPVHRFDPVSGLFRVRYAAASLRGAVLERFAYGAGAAVTEADADLVLVRLAGRPDVVDLADEATRRALDVDERISVGRSSTPRSVAPDAALDRCGRVADRVHESWGIPSTGIQYRSRHNADLRNLAFGRDTLVADQPTPATGRLADDKQAITALLAEGITVPEAWLDAM